MSGPAYITQMPPSPESNRVLWTMVCRICGVEEFMADEFDDPRLVAHTESHNSSMHRDTQPDRRNTMSDKWICGKCAREVAQGVDDGQIPEHHRTCPKRAQTEPTDHVKEEIYGGETVCATCPRNSYGAQVAWEHAHPDEREDMIAWLMRDHGDDLSPLGRDYTAAEIAGMLRRPAQEERHAGSATGV